MKRIISIIIIASLVVAGALFFQQGGSSAASEGVRRVAVTRGELVEVASTSGTVEPDVQVAVKSRQAGEVVSIHISEGDQVKAGALLVRLDPIDTEHALQETKVALTRTLADHAQARASLTVAMAEADDAEVTSEIRNRGAKLGLISDEARRTASTSAVVSQANIALRRAQLQSAKAQVASARLAIEAANRRLDEMEITAPINGTVLSVDVEQGSIVASGITAVSGGTGVVTMADLSDLRVVGDLDEAQIGRVRVGQEVTVRVDAYPMRSFTGRVHRVSPLGEESSNVVTFDVEIMITDEDSALLRSGMSADLEIITSRHEAALLIPVTAVKGLSSKRFVILASGERRAIKTGATDGVKMIVLEGLAEGDEIVVGGASSRSDRSEESSSKSAMPFGPPPPGKR